MNIIAGLLLAAAVAVVVVPWLLSWVRDRSGRFPVDTAAWDAASVQTTSTASQALLSGSRPLRSLPQLRDFMSTPHGEKIQRQLMAAGGAYGNSVEVFLAVQVFATLIGAAVMLVMLADAFAGSGLVPELPGALLAIAITALPYMRLKGQADERKQKIRQELPDFAKDLLLAVSGGLPVVGAMEFTVKKKEGEVADEVENLLLALRTKALSDEEAFMLAGERLALPEAKQFFSTLLNGHKYGYELSAQLEQQAANLEESAYQDRRKYIKSMNTKLLVYMYPFIMPYFLALVLAPAILQITDAL